VPYTSGGGAAPTGFGSQGYGPNGGGGGGGYGPNNGGAGGNAGGGCVGSVLSVCWHDVNFQQDQFSSWMTARH